MAKNSDWDLDFRDGLAGESKVRDLLSLDTIEVKTDRRWHETGNVYIETECYYVTDDAVKLSGLSVTQASHWAFVLEDSVMIIPTDKLKIMVSEFGTPITCDIEPNTSRGYLIKPSHMIEYLRHLKKMEEYAWDEHLAETWVDPNEMEDFVQG